LRRRLAISRALSFRLLRPVKPARDTLVIGSEGAAFLRAKRVIKAIKRAQALLNQIASQMLQSPPPDERAMTLIEVCIATAISALFLGSLFTMNTSSIQMIRMAREAACASQILQQRVEALRIANWHQITDADWLSSNIMNSDVAGTGSLKGETETLTLIPYGSSTPGNTQLQRNEGGPCTIVSRNDVLLAENAIKVLLQVNFTGAPNDRPMTRQTVAILAKGGVAKW
jgi:hypothetical protein